MGIFRHAGDIITITDDNYNQSSYDATWWKAEEPGYVEPADLVELIYIQGSVYRYFTTTSQVDDSLPWTDGDTYISNKATYDIDYAAAFPPNYTLQQLKDMKKAEVDAYSTDIKLGKIVYSTETYESAFEVFGRIFREFEKYNRDGSVPVGYYVTDDSDTQISLNLVGLKALVDLFVDLYAACDVKADTHKVAIQALATEGEVESYDYTTGWPTVPYNPA